MKFNPLSSLFVTISLALIPALAGCAGAADVSFPGDHWEVVDDPAQAGFDAQALASVDTLCEQAGVAALFVVRGGRIAASYGTPERRFRLASARKSMMHAVIGTHLAEGRLKLDRTLGQMGIDERTPLTETEKQATLLDLTRARSGVYLPAAFEMRGNAAARPERGSHAPGTFFYYNNWDFNVLSTVVEKETGAPFFDSFAERIAGPLGFEDFDPIGLFMRHEPDKTLHPAYLMRMSARDMARVGVLYLNDGAWKGRQIVEKDWVQRAGERVTTLTGGFAARGFYGHLWWSQDIAGEPVYYASGAGGQRMFVVPSRDLVVVTLFDSYGRGGGRHEDTIAILVRVIEAATGESGASLMTSVYVEPESRRPVVGELDEAIREHVIGSYSHPMLGDFAVESAGDAYIVSGGIGRFHILPTGTDTGWVEDMECPVVFADDPESDERQIAVSFDARGRVEGLRVSW